MPKFHPPYPAEFRQQVIELAQAGKSPADLSREFGPSASGEPAAQDGARHLGKGYGLVRQKKRCEFPELFELR